MRTYQAIGITLLLLWLSTISQAQQVRPIKLPELEKWLNQPNDTTYVINFWATWCKPCLEELPYFEEVTSRYTNQKVKVLLVSMDFPSKLEVKVKPFVQKQQLKSTVVLLDESDQNAFIERIDKTWSGAIPFTIIANGARKKSKSYEKEFTRDELEKEIQAVLSH